MNQKSDGERKPSKHPLDLQNPNDLPTRDENAIWLLSAIVDSSDDAIVSKDLEGFVTSWNKGAERLFGYTASEAVGQHITIIVPADRRHEEPMILERLRRGERVDHFETIRVRKDGSFRDISLTISPVKNNAGIVVGASKIARDITEKKEAERALHEAQEQLRMLAQDLETQVGRRTHELQERNTEVLKQRGELQELSARLLRTQDEERRKIARDLHDSVGQIVAALGMHLTGISRGAVKPETRQTALECQEMVQQLSKEIRTMSYLLHPPLLDETGLAEAIRWYMKGLADRSGLTIDLQIPDDFGRLPNDLEVAIFRIVQECLTNIHRHSGSKTAMIRLSRDSEIVSLTVQDEGNGIARDELAGIQKHRSGVGITGMRERIRNLNGVMEIRSDAKGTTISARFPLQETSENAAV